MIVSSLHKICNFYAEGFFSIEYKIFLSFISMWWMINIDYNRVTAYRY
jgi:hypothetical protein